jgi:hypothetical protein
MNGDVTLRSASGWVFGAWALASLGVSWWLGETTAYYLVDEKRKFCDAVKRTLYDLRLRLAFVPIIGYLFTPDVDMTHRDDDAD